MTREEAELKLKQQGYNDIFLAEEPANLEKSMHSHARETAIIIISGELDIFDADNTHHMKVGDMDIFSSDKKHASKMGPEGCSFVVGQK